MKYMCDTVYHGTNMHIRAIYVSHSTTWHAHHA